MMLVQNLVTRSINHVWEHMWQSHTHIQEAKGIAGKMEEGKKENGCKDHRHRRSVHEDDGVKEVVGRVFHQQLDKELPWELNCRDALIKTQGRCGSIAHQDLLIAAVWVPVPQKIVFFNGSPIERHPELKNTFYSLSYHIRNLYEKQAL